MDSEQQTFPAQGFHPQLPGGRSSGDLEVVGATLRFYSSTQEVRFPLDGLNLRFGGAGDRMLFITHPEWPEWNVYTSDLQLLNHPSLAHNRELQAKIAVLRKKRWSGTWAVLAVLFFFLACVVGLFFLKKPMAHAVAKRIPAAWEAGLGRAGLEQISLGKSLLNEEHADLEADLERLVEPLVRAVGSERYRFEFHLLEDSSLNAFALPGGVVVIHTGLIMKAETPEEILGVVAHEIAHVTEQHGLRNMVESAGLVVLIQTVFGDLSGFAAVLADAGTFFAQQSYSRAFEREADEKGLEYLEKARIDPNGLVRFFEILNEEMEDLGVGKLQEHLSWISTHPATQDRIDFLRKKIDPEQVKEYEDLDFPLSAFQEKVRKVLSE